MNDPRTARFLKLRKRAPEQLAPDESRDVARVCMLMMDWVKAGGVRKQWQELADKYAALADEVEEQDAK